MGSGPDSSELNARSFEWFVQAHQEAIYGQARRLCRNESDARDLVQETFLRAWKHFSRLERGERERAWLVTIMQRVFLDICRKRARERRGLAAIAADQPTLENTELSPPVWTEITPAQLSDAAGKLDAQLQKVYELHVHQGLPYKDIAARLGIKMGTVGTRLLRARQQLWHLLRAYVRVPS